MDLDPNTRARIEEIVGSDRIVLFMKGRRGAPQCGFSATTTELLDQLVPDYATVDVLQDPEIRDGIKTFSAWPTIPQLYVGGEFIGGCDIITEMAGTGELEDALGVPRPATSPPNLTVTDEAARALRELSASSPGRSLHLTIDARLQNGLYFGPVKERELCVHANGIELYMSGQSAIRAEGLSIDAEVTESGPSFRIENPNLPKVHEMTVQELKRRLDSGEDLRLYDVRTSEEIATARIDGSTPFDDSTRQELERSPKNELLIFHCHHGGRSQNAAEDFAALGFDQVYNVVGGIDAWSREIDSSVRRY
jgi:monothiol glutaredoxin